MTADFYYTANQRLEFNKEVEVIYSAQTISYKDDVDLVNPTFMYRADKWNQDVNYIYVSDPVNRFYFVEDVTFSKQYIYIKCSVDVLASFYPSIINLTGIVERCSTKKRYNLYLQDDRRKCFNMNRFCTIPWGADNPRGFRVNGSKTYSYILTLSGGGTNGGNNP